MNIDSFLKIGHSHTMCQDYILTGDDPCPYIILADGCSQSKDSDIGARILCHSALNFLKRNWERLEEITVHELGRDVIVHSEIISEHFNVRNQDLDATLIVAFKWNGVYKVFMYGDGVIYWIKPDDTIQYYNITFKPNAPAYLRYQIDGREDYVKNGIKMFIETVNGDQETFFGPLIPYHVIIPENAVKTLMIASDGVSSLIYKEEVLYKSLYLEMLSDIKLYNSSIHRNQNKPFIPPARINQGVKELNFKTVCSSMTDFKLTKGAFVSRRAKKTLKEYLQQGFVNDDDLSIGCFFEG